MKIGIIGMGKMGEAAARGLKRTPEAKKFFIQGSTRRKESAAEASRNSGVPCHTDNRALIGESEVILLCVKPYQVEDVLKECKDLFTKDHLLISIAASITTQQIRTWSGGKPSIIRAMPNTPCLIGEGMTVLCGAPGTAPKRLEAAEGIFSPLGRTAVVDEELMDGVTGLSGCGPAYVYLIIEALSEAGVKVGLPRKTATLLAAQTLAGAARMTLDRGEHPAALKDEVTTPAGCTIDGLMALEEGKLRVTLIKAVLAATRRSRSLRGDRSPA